MTMTTEERKAYDRGIRDAIEIVEADQKEYATGIIKVIDATEVLDKLRAKLEV